jgi:hypothetical protein
MPTSVATAKATMASAAVLAAARPINSRTGRLY